ncbi:MAG: VWA domain-containing protein [Acidobacteriota bacterium]
MKSRMIYLLLFTLFISTNALFIQAQSPQKSDDQIILSASEVVLDVVVRDKKGRIVKDLKPTDFEILEDEVKQEVTSFRLVSRDVTGVTETKKDAPTTTTTTTPVTSREPFSNISVIALVFDRLSPNARGLAHKAAMSFVNESLKPDDMATVCAIDLSLKILQPYTNDPQLLRQGIDKAASLGTSTFTAGAGQDRGDIQDRVTSLQNQASVAQGGATASGPGGAAGANASGNAIGAAVVEQKLAEMNLRALEVFDMLERDQQGYATTNGLMAMVNSLRTVPGRKSIIFFSEGIAIPPAVQAHFRAVINAANRANVSIYAVDAAGLRVQSTDAESAKEIRALGNRRASQTASGREDTSGRPLSMQLERNEDLLKLNPHSGLTDLASETGGMLISETNDLGLGLRRVDEDMRSHYVLSYVPKNQDYDGKFRKIAVKLKRSDLEVQTRKGYYAVRSTGASPVLDFEAPALAAMNRPSNAFPLRVMGFNFPEPKRAGLVPVLIEAPSIAFTYTPNKDKNTYSSDFSIIALIKDADQQVVSKLSQHYLLGGPLDKIEAAKLGEVLFYKETQLAPGRYTIEAVAYDATSKKASTQTAEFEVAGSDENRLRLSSVVILKRAEQMRAEEKKIANPFHYGELIIYPNLGEPLKKATTKQLPIFFNVYLPQGAKATPRLMIEVLQGGKKLAGVAAQLPAPDASGRIQFASAIPLDSFQPGTYQLKITVSDEQTNVSRATAFTVDN